ncbi:hypothetical protein ABTC88_18310, partial [Acinetobacter baumannii]
VAQASRTPGLKGLAERPSVPGWGGAGIKPCARGAKPGGGRLLPARRGFLPEGEGGLCPKAGGDRRGPGALEGQGIPPFPY